MAELTIDATKTGEVPCVFLEVQQVNKDNVYDLVVKSEFQAYDDVYRDIPEANALPNQVKPLLLPLLLVKKSRSVCPSPISRPNAGRIEEVLMRGSLEAMGYEVLTQEANHDVKAQNDQIDNMVSQGVKGLIVVAEDGDAAVTSVDKAADAGVKVIAYDRLIKSPKIAAYLSFDNVEVGRQQAAGVMKAIDIENWDVAWQRQAPPRQVGWLPHRQQRHPLPQGSGLKSSQPYMDKHRRSLLSNGSTTGMPPMPSS